MSDRKSTLDERAYKTRAEYCRAEAEASEAQARDTKYLPAKRNLFRVAERWRYLAEQAEHFGW